MAADWNPAAYGRFSDLRLRPALDLLAQVPSLPDGAVIDLGCGSGAVAGALAARWPGHVVVGVDSSQAMLVQAAGHYARTVQADVADWTPDMPPALVYSNAALQWLPDHGALMPRLARMLAPGGWLAVQMPRQYDLPSHRFLRDIAAHMFPDRFDFHDWQAPVWPAARYWDLLAPLGRVTVWETDYVQHLPPADTGHPVRGFTSSTAMRPIAEKLTDGELPAYLDAYDHALAAAYPLRPDGSVLMPFRRVFFTLQVP